MDAKVEQTVEGMLQKLEALTVALEKSVCEVSQLKEELSALRAHMKLSTSSDLESKQPSSDNEACDSYSGLSQELKQILDTPELRFAVGVHKELFPFLKSRLEELSFYSEAVATNVLGRIHSLQFDIEWDIDIEEVVVSNVDIFIADEEEAFLYKDLGPIEAVCRELQITELLETALYEVFVIGSHRFEELTKYPSLKPLVKDLLSFKEALQIGPFMFDCGSIEVRC